MKSKVVILGGGLAGCEAALQLSDRNVNVELWEMRPEKKTAAHESDYFAEMVCSNSLGSLELSSASGLLKEELSLLNSYFIKLAKKNSVPAGMSLAVDRILLAKSVESEIYSRDNIKVIRKECKSLDEIEADYILIATGPLTSEDFAISLSDLTNRKNFFFYDATCPVLDDKTIDMDDGLYKASRYDKGGDDFINIPLDKEQYFNFVDEMIKGEKADLHIEEDKQYFEACLPVEELASRGKETLAYGPLKPVGLMPPNVSKKPYAVVQLRKESKEGNSWQMVGFQTQLKYGEQKRIFSSLPGLSNVSFLRYGRMHRNSYINAPLILDDKYRVKDNNKIFIIGQLSGIEGYVESVSSGLYASLVLAEEIAGNKNFALPKECAIASLPRYIANAPWKNFVPSKFNFSLLPELKNTGKKMGKREKKKARAEIALQKLRECLNI